MLWILLKVRARPAVGVTPRDVRLAEDASVVLELPVDSVGALRNHIVWVGAGIEAPSGAPIVQCALEELS